MSRIPSRLQISKFLLDLPKFSSNLCRMNEHANQHQDFLYKSIKAYPWSLPFSTATSDVKSKEEVPSSEKPTENEETSSKPPTEVAELNKSILELNKQKQELDDKYKRALAETENMRRRLTKQIDDAKIYGIQSFCKDLLEVADVLSKATESVPKDEIKESNPHLKNLFEGLTMTEAQLHKVFKRHGLVPVNPLNEKFNPNLHEALFQQDVEGKESGTVVVVSKIGYKLHERILRPALVGVSKG